MEFNKEDLNNIIKPIYLMLESIDRRMESLETSNRELAKEIKTSTERYHDVEKKIDEHKLEDEGFQSRYNKEHLEIMKILDSYNPENIEKKNINNIKAWDIKLSLIVKIAGILGIIISAIVVCTLVANEHNLIKRDGINITVPQVTNK